MIGGLLQHWETHRFRGRMADLAASHAIILKANIMRQNCGKKQEVWRTAVWRFIETHTGLQWCSVGGGERCEEIAWLKHMWSVALLIWIIEYIYSYIIFWKCHPIFQMLHKVVVFSKCVVKGSTNEWIGTSSKVRSPEFLLVYFYAQMVKGMPHTLR